MLGGGAGRRSEPPLYTRYHLPTYTPRLSQKAARAAQVRHPPQLLPEREEVMGQGRVAPRRSEENCPHLCSRLVTRVHDNMR